MSEDTLTLHFTGYRVEGSVRVLLWGGQEAEVAMDPFTVQDKADIPKYINDGRYGCEAILSAECHISKSYQGFLQFEETRDYDRKEINQKNRGILRSENPKGGWKA